jgi:secreted trypsin-like serine protease
MIQRVSLLLTGAALLATSAISAERIDPRAKLERKRAAEQERVLPGIEPADGTYPFQVALLSTDMLDQSAASQANAQFCAGTLIAPEWVLTSALCVVAEGETSEPGFLTILTGSVRLDQGRRIAVEQIIAHEAYDDVTLANNVALVKLAAPVTDLAPAKLAESASDTLTGKVSFLSWGMLDDGTWPLALGEFQTELVAPAVCAEGLEAGVIAETQAMFQDANIDAATLEAVLKLLEDGLSDLLVPGQICTDNTLPGSAPTQGSDGGPLLRVEDGNTVQIGIISAGWFPPLAHHVHSDVGYVRAWIREKSGV